MGLREKSESQIGIAEESICESNTNEKIPKKNVQQKFAVIQSFCSACFSRQWKKYSKWLGMLLALASGLLMTLYSALYRLVKKDIDNSTVLILRGVIQIGIMLIIIFIQKINFAPKKMDQKTKFQTGMIWIIFICVCIFGGFRLCMLFAALERIPMALVHTILNGSPVVVMVLSHFLLKDPCNMLRTICTFALVAGVLLIFQPQDLFFPKENEINSTSMNSNNLTSSGESYDNGSIKSGNSSISTTPISTKATDDLMGYIFSVGALFFSAVGSVLTKKITQNFEKMVISLFLGVCIGIIGLLQLMIFEPKAPVLPETFYPWCIAVIVGFLGVAQQFCLIAALKLESPTRVTVIRSLNIVISFIVQIQAWNENPGLDQIGGAIIVVGAIVVVTFEEPIINAFKSCWTRCTLRCTPEKPEVQPDV